MLLLAPPVQKKNSGETMNSPSSSQEGDVKTEDAGPLNTSVSNLPTEKSGKSCEKPNAKELLESSRVNKATKNISAVRNYFQNMEENTMVRNGLKYCSNLMKITILR